MNIDLSAIPAVIFFVIVSFLVKHTEFTTADDQSCHQMYKYCILGAQMTGTDAGVNDTLDADETNQSNITASGPETCLREYKICVDDALSFLPMKLPSTDIQTNDSGPDDTNTRNMTLYLADKVKIGHENHSASKQDDNTEKQDSGKSISVPQLGSIPIKNQPEESTDGIENTPIKNPDCTTEENIPVNDGFSEREWRLIIIIIVLSGFIVLVTVTVIVFCLFYKIKFQRRVSEPPANSDDANELKTISTDQGAPTPNIEPGNNQNGIPEPYVGNQPNERI